MGKGFKECIILLTKSIIREKELLSIGFKERIDYVTDSQVV